MLLPRRHLLAACVLPLVLGIAWIGCATASDQPAGETQGKDSGVDTSTSGGDDADASVDEDGNIFDAVDDSVVDMGLQCPGVTPSNTCATAIEIATLAVGGKTQVTGAVLAGAGERWYKVTFTGTDDPTAHPHLKITSDDKDIAFEVVNMCGGGNPACGDEDANAKPTTDWEMSYRADPDAALDGTYDPDAAAKDDAPSPFIPITVGNMGAMYLRVYRKSAGTACDYKIDVSN